MKARVFSAPVAPWWALRVAAIMYQTHRRPPRLPWHPVATAVVGFCSTLAGASYATSDFDAVAVVWRATPAGIGVGLLRLGVAGCVLPVAAAVLTRTWFPAVAVALAEVAALGVTGALFEVSSYRARVRWLAKPRRRKPPREDKTKLFRSGHLVGLGVGVRTPHAADDLCRSIVRDADLPIYLLAATPAHVRLYRRFGFEVAGPSWYGETPMRCDSGPRTVELRSL